MQILLNAFALNKFLKLNVVYTSKVVFEFIQRHAYLGADIGACLYLNKYMDIFVCLYRYTVFFYVHS